MYEKSFKYHHDLGVTKNPSVGEWGSKSLSFWFNVVKMLSQVYEAMVKLPLHKAKALTHLRMHSMMVLKKSNDNLHLKFGKDIMISSQMLSTPSKPNPLLKTQVVPKFYS